MASEFVLVCRPVDSVVTPYSGCPVDSSGMPQGLLGVQGYLLSVDQGSAFEVSTQPPDYAGLGVTFSSFFGVVMFFYLVGKMAGSIKRVL